MKTRKLASDFPQKQQLWKTCDECKFSRKDCMKDTAEVLSLYTYLSLAEFEKMYAVFLLAE